MVRYHLVQPAHSTDKKIKSQRTRETAPRFPVHQELLFTSSPQLPTPLIFLMSKQLRGP